MDDTPLPASQPRDFRAVVSGGTAISDCSATSDRAAPIYGGAISDRGQSVGGRRVSASGLACGRGGVDSDESVLKASSSSTVTTVKEGASMEGKGGPGEGCHESSVQGARADGGAVGATSSEEGEPSQDLQNGLAETSGFRCMHCGRVLKSAAGRGAHARHCAKNPDRASMQPRSKRNRLGLGSEDGGDGDDSLTRRSSKRVRSSTTFFSPALGGGGSSGKEFSSLASHSSLLDDNAFRSRRIQLTVETGPLGIEITEVVRIEDYKKREWSNAEIRMTAKRAHCHPFINKQVPLGARLNRINGISTKGCNYAVVAKMLCERRPVSIEFEWEGTLVESRWAIEQPSKSQATRLLDKIIDSICIKDFSKVGKRKTLVPPPGHIQCFKTISGAVWSPEEILAFLALSVVYHNELSQVQKCLETKTLKQVVEFYHIWLTTHSFRSYWTRYGAAREYHPEEADERDGRNGVFRANIGSPRRKGSRANRSSFPASSSSRAHPRNYSTNPVGKVFKFECKFCGKNLKSEAGRATHERYCQGREKDSMNKSGGSSEYPCSYCGRVLKSPAGRAAHERHCVAKSSDQMSGQASDQDRPEPKQLPMDSDNDMEDPGHERESAEER